MGSNNTSNGTPNQQKIAAEKALEKVTKINEDLMAKVEKLEAENRRLVEKAANLEVEKQHGVGIVIKHPDGTPYTQQEIEEIIAKGGEIKIHGSNEANKNANSSEPKDDAAKSGEVMKSSSDEEEENNLNIDRTEPEEEEYDFDFNDEKPFEKAKNAYDECRDSYREKITLIASLLKEKKGGDKIREIVDEESKNVIRSSFDRNIFEEFLYEYNTHKKDEGFNLDNLVSKFDAIVVSDFEKYPEFKKLYQKKVGKGWERIFDPLYIHQTEEVREKLREFNNIETRYSHISEIVSDFDFFKKVVKIA
ncbi:MAG: hypothetical protein IJ772_05520 [Bacilli bacterium]|nr:hypothetical protein [Bacilli bacterium]